MERVVRSCNWYFDTLNCWRVLDEVELPELTFGGEDFAPGGHMMGVSWPEDLQPLKATIKLKTDDERVRSLCGRQPGNYVTASYYENLQSFRDGAHIGRVILLKGLISSVKPDTRKGLKASGTQYEFSTVVSYHDVFNGKSVHRFDFFAGPGVTLIDGVNPFDAFAANLAILGGTTL